MLVLGVVLDEFRRLERDKFEAGALVESESSMIMLGSGLTDETGITTANEDDSLGLNLDEVKARFTS